ncbi:MAG TPA: sigma-70 family RNA polymerase sigma factor [Anaerolineae bacterium]|nr:sigma-70 family RNA polymerase sigma factor [Anaerolineae bacterium]HNU04616.1 sigma-70 family RNA polymerase sigma factor [Anaerolineae bacterium]
MTDLALSTDADQLAASSGELALEHDAEAVLIEQAKEDPLAFGVLYERYVDRIYSYIYYRTGNQQDAEDLTARTFFKALDHIGRFNNRGVPFSAWLYRIAHNLVANWHRDRSRRRELVLEDQSHLSHSSGNPEHFAEASEAREALMSAIRQLPDDRQQLILLKFSDALPNAQIGVIMGRSEGAIKSLYHRTLLALREDLQQRGFI